MHDVGESDAKNLKRLHRVSHALAWDQSWLAGFLFIIHALTLCVYVVLMRLFEIPAAASPTAGSSGLA
jgi:hypothetical protein